MKVRKIEKKKINTKRRPNAKTNSSPPAHESQRKPPNCVHLQMSKPLKLAGTAFRLPLSPSSSSSLLLLFLLLLTVASLSSLNLLQITSVQATTSVTGASNNIANTNNGPSTAASISSGNPVIKPKYKTLYACEDRQLTIDCEPNSRINLIRANYGRFSLTQCNEQGLLDLSIDCMSPITFRIMRERCQDKQRCSVNATNSIFGDKCPKTRKYLEVHFQCQLTSLTSSSSSSMDADLQQPPLDKVDLRTTSAPTLAASNVSPPQYQVSQGMSPILPPNNPPFGTPPAKIRPHYHQQQQPAEDHPMFSTPSWPPRQQQQQHQQQPQQLQPMTVINSEIVNSSFVSGSLLAEPTTVTLRHNLIDNVSNPRCVLWDPSINQWTGEGAQLVDTNSTHTTCAFNQASSYLLVMDYLAPSSIPSPQYPQQPQPPPMVNSQPPLQTPQIYPGGSNMDLASPYPNLDKLQPIDLPPQPMIVSGKPMISPNQPAQVTPAVTSALFGWLSALFVFLFVATIAFIASNMRSTAGAALKSLGNFTAFGGPNKFNTRGRQSDVGSLHNKDLLVINNQNGHQFLYAPASTTKISGSASSTHILSPSNNAGQHQGTLHQIQQQQLYSQANGTLSNLSGTGAQSNNYYYGLMGLNLFQQQQQQQHHMSQHHLNQQPHQTMSPSSYHQQANKSTISTESANSTPSSSGVESGSTGLQQQQQQQQQANSCLIMNNDYNLMGQQQVSNNYHQASSLMNNQPTLTLNAHYSSGLGPMVNSQQQQQQQQQRQHQQHLQQQRLIGLMDGNQQIREHIYECVDDDKPSYASRLLMPMNLVKTTTTTSIDPFNSNTLNQQQHLQQQQHQRAMTLSSRMQRNNAFQQQQQQQQQHQQANSNKRLFSHPAIVCDNQVTKTDIVFSKMAQVAPQRATEISNKFHLQQQHDVMAVYNDNHASSTSSAATAVTNSSASPLFAQQSSTCYTSDLAGSKLGTDC